MSFRKGKTWGGKKLGAILVKRGHTRCLGVRLDEGDGRWVKGLGNAGARKKKSKTALWRKKKVFGKEAGEGKVRGSL